MRHTAGPSLSRLMAHAGIPALVTVLEGKAVLKVLYLAVRNPEEFRSHNAGIRSSG